jgi:integrase
MHSDGESRTYAADLHGTCTVGGFSMTFITDKEELKPGLIIFRRADVDHRNWYCRIKVPKADRYKTVSLKTSDINDARERAYDQDADVRFRLKHDVPVFNHPFSHVAQEYLAAQQARANRGEISAERPKKLKSVIEAVLNAYVGSTQVHLIGQESWENYPAWRRKHGEGRYFRNGRSKPEAEPVKASPGDSKEAVGGALKEETRKPKALISDATIRFEMSIFGAVMGFALSKRYVPASNRLVGRPSLKTMRRDEFTLEEYRHLHTTGRTWVKAAIRPSSTWYRTVAYNFILIMCNTGMRPSEAKNLRWRDIMPAKDRDGREIVVLFVRGKGKQRKLVAPKSVGDYLNRIRDIAKAKELDDPVFTTVTGEPAKSLYQAMIEDLLIEAKLRDGPNGIPRSTYCFRHTYATFRLGEGVDVYFLAEQMGTSVKMIEDHYGHVNTIKHADRVLQGMGGWDPIEIPVDITETDAKAAKAAATKQKGKPRPSKH